MLELFGKVREIVQARLLNRRFEGQVDADSALLHDLSDRVAQLREQVGDFPIRFHALFKGAIASLDYEEMTGCIVEAKGVHTVEAQSPSWLVKHILGTRGLVRTLRYTAHAAIKGASFEYHSRIGTFVNHDSYSRETGRWRRTLAALKLMELLSAGMDPDELAAAAELEALEDQFRTHLAEFQGRYGGPEFRSWKETMQRVDRELEQTQRDAMYEFLVAFVRARCFRDLHYQDWLKADMQALHESFHEAERMRLEVRVEELESEVARLTERGTRI